MDGFEVTLDEVRSAATRLEALLNSVGEAPLSRTSEYGHTQLERSGRAFADRWGQGVRDLRDGVEAAAVKLRTTADAYEQADADVAAKLHEVSGE